MFAKLAELQKAGITAVLVTIVDTKGSSPREAGTKMVVTDRDLFGTIGGGNLEWIALQNAREMLQSNITSKKMSVPLSAVAEQCCGGAVELFFELVQSKAKLVIFGAGHVTQSLLEVMRGTEFGITVIDQRKDWLELARSASQQSAQTVDMDPLLWIEKHTFDSKTDFCLVMTHDHELDEQIVEKLLLLDLKYLGLIGSQTKKRRFESRFLQKEFDPKTLQKLKCPVGLPIGGKAPKEVAISIAAELIQKFYEV